MIKKILLLLIFVLSLFFMFSSVIVQATEATIDDPPIEEPARVEEVGFFEKIIVGIYEFIVSPEFTKLCTSISALMLAVYPFVKKYLSAKAQAKFNKITKDLADWQKTAENYKKLAAEYAKIADGALQHVTAIKDSLVLGFDKSSLRQDVKDKILDRLNSVPNIDAIASVEGAIIEDEPIITQIEKDSTLTEAVLEEPVPAKLGW